MFFVDISEGVWTRNYSSAMDSGYGAPHKRVHKYIYIYIHTSYWDGIENIEGKASDLHRNICIMKKKTEFKSPYYLLPRLYIVQDTSLFSILLYFYLFLFYYTRSASSPDLSLGRFISARRVHNENGPRVRGEFL